MAKKHILVVDDEEDILELVRYNLEREGFHVLCAASGEEALRIAAETSLDIIILDLMLSGIDGLEVARRLKKNSRTQSIPIVMLTAKGEESDIVTGLELGADDYITKPFSPRVLTARIRAVVRRLEKDRNAPERTITLPHLTIDLARRAAAVDGRRVELTFTEFEVLSFLAKRPGWVFTRTQIVDAVRGDHYPVTDRSVDVQIVGLRRKLDPYGHCIETVRGVGYRFAEFE